MYGKKPKRIIKGVTKRTWQERLEEYGETQWASFRHRVPVQINTAGDLRKFYDFLGYFMDRYFPIEYLGTDLYNFDKRNGPGPCYISACNVWRFLGLSGGPDSDLPITKNMDNFRHHLVLNIRRGRVFEEHVMRDANQTTKSKRKSRVSGKTPTANPRKRL